LTEPRLILGIGELLWDTFPDGSRDPGNSNRAAAKGLLGGAPANFSVMVGQLGNHAAILSRIGRDDLGRKAIDVLDRLPVDTNHLQVDTSHETGRVTVALKDGQPEYVIHQPSAWDFLELSDEWVQLGERADAICFGSLAQRSVESRKSIQALVAQSSAACVRIFDVNLRAPFYSAEILRESLELATVVKMNDAEVPTVLTMLGLQAEDNHEATELLSGARVLAEFPHARMVAITRGGRGSILITREGWHEHPGIPATVADTIGAGDAFTAAITHYLLRGAGLPKLNEAGNRWGSWMASQSGAMPMVPDDVRAGIAAAIEDRA
jgi:fructokinase